MTLKEVMKELESYGNPSTKKVLMNHGAKEPFFGVKVADLKKILKKTKTNHELALQLYDTGNSDAMYLAGYMVDENKVTKKMLNDWVKKAYWQYLSEYAVPWVAVDSGFGLEVGLEWIESKDETIQAAGWAALSSYLSVTSNDEIDIQQIEILLDRAQKNLHESPNRARYTMNGFIIAVGSYLPELHDKALSAASAVGKVHVDVGGTACKVPLATEYIKKIKDKGRLGKKRKMARC
ncbi:MAG: DNA alkylation repair protein [Saprospiraceae bacterium]|nr:DNA alkylation repair protein [Saprospiraceae bacterium]